jgi:hypothetical protein
MRYTDIENAAAAQGWRVEPTKRRHRRLIPADESCAVVIGAGTGSDHRGAAVPVRRLPFRADLALAAKDFRRFEPKTWKPKRDNRNDHPTTMRGTP